MDARRAARRMVDGVLDGKPLVVLSWLAHLGIRVHGLSPTLTVAAMGVANRFLPSAPREEAPIDTASPATAAALAPTATLTGRQAAQRLSSGAGQVVGTLTTLGRRAAQRLNQR